MIHGIPADHHIPNVQVIAQRAGNAGVHQAGHVKQVTQNLGAQRRIDLADAALHHRHRQSFQNAIMEDAACNFFFRFLFH